MDMDLIWVEKYRPSTLDDLIIDETNKSIIKSFGKNIPNLLLCGSPGTGKCLDGDEELEIFVEEESEYRKIMEFLEREKHITQNKYMNDNMEES